MSKEDLGKKLSQEIDNAYQALDKKEASDYIDGLMEEIKEPAPKIPEPVFRTIFLPYFIGDKVPDKNNLVIQEWCGVVGSSSLAADVVNSKGEVLFTVPPMYDTSAIDRTTNASQRNFGALYVELADELKLSPGLARRHMKEEIVPRLVDMIGDRTGGSWDDVLNYYGIKTSEDVKNITPPDENKKKVADDSQFDFE